MYRRARRKQRSAPARLTARRACRPLARDGSRDASRPRCCDRGGASRTRLPLRARVPGTRRVSPTLPPDDVAGRPRAPVRDTFRAIRRRGSPRLVHPGRFRRTRACRRAHPRLGIGARPDAAAGAVPARGGFPLPDDRHPRPWREPARDDAADGGRVRRRCPRRVPGTHRSPGRDERSDRRTFDGCDRSAAGWRGRPSGRRGRRDVHAGRPIPAHAPDLPPRAAADPRPDRLPPRLADDARLPAAEAACRRGYQRDRRSHPVRGPDPADPWR